MYSAVTTCQLHILMSKLVLMVLFPRLDIGTAHVEAVVIHFAKWTVELGDVGLYLLRRVVHGLGHRGGLGYRLVLGALC